MQFFTTHPVGVDLEDLVPAALVRQANLNLDLQTTRAQQGIIQHIATVGHTNQQDVVQGIHTINLWGSSGKEMRTL